MWDHGQSCLLLIVLTTVCFRYVASAAVAPRPNTEGPAFWRTQAKDRLQRMLDTKENTNVAKNVILFLGDGMSLTTITAARILKGQNQNKTGEETVLSFEKFSTSGHTKTYNVDRMTPDSAGTATALMTGVKTNMGIIGLDSTSVYGKCESAAASQQETILEWSAAEGKSTGVVTTTRVTHATPAAAYAKSASRNWEGDMNLPHDMKGGCTDIAHQLVTNNSDIAVVMGGGWVKFLPQNATDPLTGQKLKGTGRKDGVDLIQTWLKLQEDKGRNCDFVANRTEMMAADGDCILGLFNEEHMSYELDREKTDEPSLAEMTEKAIKLLSKNDKGFFLFIEGGRIDHAHHEGVAKKALYDTLAMEEAVEKAVSMTDETDTLVVVTSDHSHTMVMTGYPSRGNPILGLNDYFDQTTEYGSTRDHKPLTTLLYGDGPGYLKVRENLTGVDTYDSNYHQQSAVPIKAETHGGDDVAVFANGPMAHLLTGVYEQNYIPHALAYASCVGTNQNHCAVVPKPAKESTTAKPCSRAETLRQAFWSISLSCCLVLLVIALED